MSEKQIRLSEVDLLESYLNLHGIDNDTLRAYVGQRRKAIESDFPEAVAEVEQSASVQGEGEQQAGAGDTGSGGDPGVQQPATSAQGEGTQSPTPDAANQAPSATAS